MNPNLTANLRAEAQLKLAIVREKLAAAQPQLTEAVNLIHSLGLAASHGEMYSHVADALHYCGEAISEIDQHPQPEQ